jgi:serine/threonine-protein kinase
MSDASDSATRAAGVNADPLIRRRVRDLLIVERIGRGGMGAVYRAQHQLLREPRAVKVIRAELFRAVPDSVERFEREARIAVRLRHPNLVLIHDFFVEDGDRFLVMEYVVGQSLADLLRERGELPPSEVCRLGSQCCAGLAHAHELGIVHRDLSPENVMLTPSADGVAVKIIDFGVARAALDTDVTRLDGDVTLTHAGQFVGKPRYASPEQAGGLKRGETLDARSDLYTLGLVLYQMLTGELPFRSDSAAGYLALQLFQTPTAPSELRPELDVPPELERVILRCLAKDRNERFATARELGEALDAAARAIAARPPRRRRALPGQLRGAAPLAAFATVVAVALGLVAWRSLPWTSGAAPAAKVAEAAQAQRPAQTAPPQLAEAARPAEPVTPPREAPLPAQPAPKSEPSESRVPLTPPQETAAQAAAAPATAPPVSRTPETRAPVTPARAPAAKPAPPSPAPEAPARAETPHTAGPGRFGNEDEMQRAFDAALAFQQSHSSEESIARWKAFRARQPSRELDERAKRQITDLTLGGMRSFP